MSEIKYKICSKCEVLKPHSDYFKDNARDIGIRPSCKACSQKETIEWRNKHRSEYNNYVAQWRAKNPDKQHATEIKRDYGLDISDYNRIILEQRNKCAICNEAHNPKIKRGRLYVDHDHKTGLIRGLLCGGCNSMLGYAKDSVETLQKAIDYLAKHKK